MSSSMQKSSGVHCYCCNCRFQFCCRCRSTIIDIRFFYYLLFVLYQASFAVTMMTIRVLWIACAIVGLVRNNLHNVRVMILRRREWLFYAYILQFCLPSCLPTDLCCQHYTAFRSYYVFIVLFSPPPRLLSCSTTLTHISTNLPDYKCLFLRYLISRKASWEIRPIQAFVTVQNYWLKRCKSKVNSFRRATEVGRGSWEVIANHWSPSFASDGSIYLWLLIRRVMLWS